MAKARRATGLWSDGDTFDALLDALQASEDATEEPEKKSALKTARRSLLSAGRDVGLGVAAAIIARISGIE